jgi:uncharacterized protein DUF3300
MKTPSGNPATRLRPRPALGLASRILPAASVLILAGCTTTTYLPEQQTQYVQGPPQAPAYYPETPAPQAAAPNPLDQLLAPIALYPDPLISIILPASTFPSDVASAGAYLNGGGDPGQAGDQPWDPSVRSLAHYPDVAKWMAQNQEWTQAVGAAFASQPADVMRSIQRLRELAQADGTLTDTAQQQVIVSSTYVEIEPAQPDVIYVPIYDPAIVFVDQPYYGYGGPFFAYGPPYEASAWLTFGCNWGGGGVLIVDEGYWRGSGGGWRSHDQASFAVSAGVRPWSYPANRPMPQAPSGWRSSPQVVAVRPIAGAPARPPQSAFRDIHTTGPAAVAVVARNPAAFKGRPINSAILPRAAGAPSKPAQAAQANQTKPQGRPESAGPAVAVARVNPYPAAAERPQEKAPEPARAQAPEAVRAPQAAERAEDQKEAPDARQPGEKKADPKKAVKPVAKKPEVEKPKDDEPPH